MASVAETLSSSVTPAPLMSLAPLEAARQFIDKISKPACILVAISGGSDSTGLLIALRTVLRDAGRDDIYLQAVTIDHALRPESADEARGVAALCAKLDIPHYCRRWDAAKPVTGISAAARLARYALIGAVAEEIDADMIVVGHTRGDQQETIAMRGARSQRPDNLGLAGMADAVLYNGRHWIMRPFLNSTRQDIRDFLIGEEVSWYDDPSNNDANYERVRTRQALPEASEILSDRSINRFELSARAAHFIENHVESFLDCLINIRVEDLSEEPIVLRHALSAVASVIGGRRFAMAADSMDKVMAFVAQAEPGRMTAGRVVFDRRKDGLYLMRENRNIAPVTVTAGEKAIWDERFEITNASDNDLLVHALGSEPQADKLGSFPASVPQGVAKRAVQSMPGISGEGRTQMLSTLESVEIRPLLAPYDLFLPRFDLALANSIAPLFGRTAYTQPMV